MTVPKASVVELTCRYGSRFPSCGGARTYRELTNALARSVGTEQFRDLLRGDEQLCAAYAAS